VDGLGVASRGLGYTLKIAPIFESFCVLGSNGGSKRQRREICAKQGRMARGGHGFPKVSLGPFEG
jgi:hypothetical protein